MVYLSGAEAVAAVERVCGLHTEPYGGGRVVWVLMARSALMWRSGDHCGATAANEARPTLQLEGVSNE